MKECAKANLASTIVALSLSVAAACGGGAAAAPPAVATTNPATPTATDGSGSEPSAPASSSAVSLTDAPPGSTTEPSEAPADLGAGDTRTTDSIAALVKAHRKEARDCYEKALKQIPGLKGDIVIHFTLKPNGEVKQAELNEPRSTIREASVTTCVIGVVRTIAFPKSSKGLETTVNYPFNFNP
jgi:hypothetical protein